MGLANDMRDYDAVIWGTIGERLRVGNREVPGIFFKGNREIKFENGDVIGLSLSFDCTISADVRNLIENQVVEVRDSSGRSMGTYRFLRRYPDEGDETGLVTLELGTLK